MGKGDRVRPLRADVRAGVVAAARDVFAEVGYHRASLDAIARRAGYSKGAVYSNFASKDELFLAFLEPQALAMAAAVTDSARPTGDLGADLDRIAAGLEHMVAASPANLLFAEFRAYAARDADVARRLAEGRSAIVDRLAEGLPDVVAALGGRLAVPPRDAVVLLLAVVNGLALEHVGVDEPPVAPTSLGALLRGLVLPADAPPAAG